MEGIAEERDMQCEHPGCDTEATYRATIVDRIGHTLERNVCAAHIRWLIEQALSIPPPEQQEGRALADAAEVAATTVISDWKGENCLVSLRCTSGSGHLIVRIGVAESWAIGKYLKTITSPRPLTHHAMVNAIRALGAEVEHAVISPDTPEAYKAEVMLRRGDEAIPLDVRPSDAICLALVTEKPLFVKQSLLVSPP